MPAACLSNDFRITTMPTNIIVHKLLGPLVRAVPLLMQPQSGSTDYLDLITSVLFNYRRFFSLTKFYHCAERRGKLAIVEQTTLIT